MWNLNNKKTLVTGGTKGIGLAVVNEFLELGAEVFVVAGNTSSLVDELKSDRLFAIDGDLSDSSFRKKIIQSITDRWGRLDVLVNNVGTNVRKKFIEYSEDEYLRASKIFHSYHEQGAPVSNETDYIFFHKPSSHCKPRQFPHTARSQ